MARRDSRAEPAVAQERREGADGRVWCAVRASPKVRSQGAVLPNTLQHVDLLLALLTTDPEFEAIFQQRLYQGWQFCLQTAGICRCELIADFRRDVIMLQSGPIRCADDLRRKERQWASSVAQRDETKHVGVDCTKPSARLKRDTHRCTSDSRFDGRYFESERL